MNTYFEIIDDLHAQYNTDGIKEIDFSKDNPSSDIRGNNNEMDTLNTQLNVASRLQATILRNSNIRDTYQLEGPFSCEPFTERFEANLSGWSVTFSISMNNSMTSC